jgi:DAK2 domain fusion protein YloV
MLAVGVKTMVEKYKYIDQLNIFPVPDGDTGTNMKITLEGGAKAITGLEFENLFLFGKAFNRGLLMNARGNSGVITSQIFKGFFKNITENQVDMSIDDLIEAFASAKETAYKAVMNPVEGTILTIIRVVSEVIKAKQKTFKSIDELFDSVVETAEKTLLTTPELLPELKEANVVDSGGYGLCRVFEGMNQALDEEIGKTEVTKTKKILVEKTEEANNLPAVKKEEFKDNNEGFGYCNEFIIELGSRVTTKQKKKETFDLNYFKKQLGKMGNSIVCVVDENILKVHIHSEDPWGIFAFASRYGEFLKVKVENMTQQFLANNPGTTLESLAQQAANAKKFSNATTGIKVIVTVPSRETGAIFEERVGTNYEINTETTGNPSVEKFYNVFKKVNSSNIILILDDSNYLLSAKQAAGLLPKNIRCEIFSARSVSNAFYLCSLINQNQSYAKNIKTLWVKIKHASVCQISKSVKDGRFNKIKVKKGEYIGIANKKIVAANGDLLSNVKNTIIELLGGKTKYTECVIFTGDEAMEGVVDEVKAFIKTKYKISSDIYNGDIPNYPFTIAFI